MWCRRRRRVITPLILAAPGAAQQWGETHDNDRSNRLRHRQVAGAAHEQMAQVSARRPAGVGRGDGWAILFSHPKDFTPVCTTELGYMVGLMPEFQKRNCKIIGLSVDPVDNHSRWAKDIEETQGHAVTYPLIGDPQLKIAQTL